MSDFAALCMTPSLPAPAHLSAAQGHEKWQAVASNAHVHSPSLFTALHCTEVSGLQQLLPTHAYLCWGGT